VLACPCAIAPDEFQLAGSWLDRSSPSQADLGAQSYWLHCLPCHGDRGQGLSDEFRLQYPPGHQNCWEAGCHGPRPYEDAFQVPTIVPAVIGSGELDAYGDAGVLGAYIRAAMPRQAPGSLDETTSWEIAAFLPREIGVGGRGC
jgi:hypothetical protein